MWDARPNAPSAGAETRDLRLSRTSRKRVKVCAQYAYALGLASHHVAGCPSYPSHHVAGCHRTCDVTSARRARLPLDLKLLRPGGRVIFAGCAQLRRRQTAQRRAGGDAQPRPRGLRAAMQRSPMLFGPRCCTRGKTGGTTCGRDSYGLGRFQAPSARGLLRAFLGSMLHRVGLI